jgi:hypothetical protein
MVFHDVKLSLSVSCNIMAKSTDCGVRLPRWKSEVCNLLAGKVTLPLGPQISHLQNGYDGHSVIATLYLSVHMSVHVYGIYLRSVPSQGKHCAKVG